MTSDTGRNKAPKRLKTGRASRMDGDLTGHVVRHQGIGGVWLFGSGRQTHTRQHTPQHTVYDVMIRTHL